MSKNLIIAVVVIVLLVITFLVFLYRRELKRKREYKIKYWDKCLQLRKTQAKPTFVSARNSINSFHSEVPASYHRYDELESWFVTLLTETIMKAFDFKDIFIIFASFEDTRDTVLWEKIKKANPGLVDHLTKIVSKEVETLKFFSDNQIETEEKERLRIVAEKVFQFIRQGFLETEKGHPLEVTAREVKEIFEGKRKVEVKA